jgi:uncharacterized protein (TIGR03032 family)
MSACKEADASWARHNAQWRDPAQVASQWEEAKRVEPSLFRRVVRGQFFEALDRAGITLLVSREYEHLLLALSVRDGRPHETFMSLPHPSGIAVNSDSGNVFVASTRNPNQIFEFAPVSRTLERSDVSMQNVQGRPLIPIRSTFFPGSLYMHDLAFVEGVLHANAVGHNAVIRIELHSGWQYAWWPRAIEHSGQPDFSRNYLQLNSIAAGAGLERSYFSASTDRVSPRRPGHLNFPVNKRGVIFCGLSREPVVRGLTRPHSARLYENQLWVANSGYGELAFVEGNRAVSIIQLPGWTRGLCFDSGIAFVGTSRVIPRFRVYAPGLDLDRSVCGVFAVDVTSGRVIGSVTWPQGNQIFAVERLQREVSLGFPFQPASRGRSAGPKLLFYNFDTDSRERRRPR